MEEGRGRGFVGVTVEGKYVGGGGGGGRGVCMLLKGLLMVQLQQLRLALAQDKPLGHTELYCLNNVASVTPWRESQCPSRCLRPQTMALFSLQWHSSYLHTPRHNAPHWLGWHSPKKRAHSGRRRPASLASKWRIEPPLPLGHVRFDGLSELLNKEKENIPSTQREPANFCQGRFCSFICKLKTKAWTKGW